MHTTRRARRALATVLTGAVIVAGSLFGGSAATAAPPAPAVMAALGDSITQAIMTCSSLSTCAANSWSTGTTASVGSHAAQLKKLNPALAVYNDAVSGANSSALLGQAQKAVTQKAQYVTIEIGANDACTKSVTAMTPVGDPANPVAGTFVGNVKAGLDALAASGTEIFVASIPNLKTMYTTNSGSASARLTWTLLQVCQSMLASPSSVKPADVARRDAVQTRVTEYNNALKALCGATAKCRFDNFAIANLAFGKADISTRDYFHPSLAGQATFARVTWAETQWVK